MNVPQRRLAAILFSHGGSSWGKSRRGVLGVGYVGHTVHGVVLPLSVVIWDVGGMH